MDTVDGGGDGADSLPFQDDRNDGDAAADGDGQFIETNAAFPNGVPGNEGDGLLGFQNGGRDGFSPGHSRRNQTVCPDFKPAFLQLSDDNPHKIRAIVSITDEHSRRLGRFFGTIEDGVAVIADPVGPLGPETDIGRTA